MSAPSAEHTCTHTHEQLFLTNSTAARSKSGQVQRLNKPTYRLRRGTTTAPTHTHTRSSTPSPAPTPAPTRHTSSAPASHPKATHTHTHTHTSVSNSGVVWSGCRFNFTHTHTHTHTHHDVQGVAYAHDVSRLAGRQPRVRVRALGHHAPEVVFRLAARQAANGVAGQVPLHKLLGERCLGRAGGG